MPLRTLAPIVAAAMAGAAFAHSALAIEELEPAAEKTDD